MRASHLPKFLAVPLTFLSLCSLGLRAQTVTVRPVAGPFDPTQLNLETPPPQGFAVRAGRMFDAKAGRNLTNQVILIRDGRITGVGPADRVQIPQGAKVIDLSRATVLPGLIDRHVHLMQDAQPNEARLVFIGTHNTSRASFGCASCIKWTWRSIRPGSTVARLVFIGTHYALKNLYAGFTTLQ